MSTLRQKMEGYLKLRGLSTSTIKAYLGSIRAFARFHMKSPAEMGEPEVRAFLTHLTDDRKLQPSSVAIYIAALKVMYLHILNRPDVVSWIPWPKKSKRLPTILTAEEIGLLLAATESARTRAMIMAGYGSGLRISEVTHLRPGDIDSSRGVLWVRSGKGAKDRLAPLPQCLLDQFRDYWRLCRPKGPWLFPSSVPDKAISRKTANKYFRRAVGLSGITRPIRFHNLRHSFATHLMEEGTSLLEIQALLGHTSIRTSMVYLRVRSEHLKTIKSPLENIPVSRSSPLE